MRLFLSRTPTYCYSSSLKAADIMSFRPMLTLLLLVLSGATVVVLGQVCLRHEWRRNLQIQHPSPHLRQGTFRPIPELIISPDNLGSS